MSRSFLEELFGNPEDNLNHQITRALEAIHEKWRAAQEVVRGLFGGTYLIDEMALWAPSVEACQAIVTELVSRQGYACLNYAKDTVHTSPLTSVYEARYWFIYTPFDYRIEVMCQPHGFSPFHGILSAAMDPKSMIIAHASFKVDSEEAYAATVHSMREDGMEVLQHCTSDYGRFSYFSNVGKELLPAIKPRLNTRDAR